MVDSERPRLLLVAGPNGAGKTTVTEQGLAHTWFRGCEYVNPDKSARERRRELCLAERRSLAFESVFSAPDKPAFLRRARAAGYFVRLFFVGTARPEINAARVARRVMQGGHDVPIPKILSRYVRSIANAAAVAAEVDRLYLYDNSVDDADPTLVLRAACGVVQKRYAPPPAWAAPIVSRLS